MKTCLLSILCLLSSVSCFAADPVVTVDNAANVKIDGVNAGQAADVIRNHPEQASAVQRALADYVSAQTAAAAVAMQRADKLATALTAEREAARKQFDADRKALAAEAARVSALLAALSKVDPAMLPEPARSAYLAALQTEDEREIAAAEARKAAALERRAQRAAPRP